MVREDDHEVYRKHADQLVALATALVGPDGADDVVADVVARTMGSPRWHRVEDRYAYWVRCVYNEAKSSYRSSMRRLAREERAAALRPTELAATAVPYPEVLEAMARLSTRQRAVVYLVYWEDLTPHQSAELLGISQGSVKRHLARARAHLRRYLS